MKLVYSPIAWLMLAVFTVMSAASLTEMLQFVSDRTYGGVQLFSVTELLFAGHFGIMASAFDRLYVFIPLVTMGLFSRETQSGSIRLLQSSPVTSVEVVIGKFFSVVAYCGALSVVMVSIMITAGLAVDSLDYPAVMTGILGFFLLACAYSAIGLFMSTLTSSQIVAAISTMAVLFGLTQLDSFGQTIPIVGKIAYWFSLGGHTNQLRDGLISSSDMLFFVCVIAMMLSFSVLKLLGERRRESQLKSGLRYAGVVALAAVVGYLASMPRFTVYFDATRIKSQSVTTENAELMEELDGPIQVTSYVNINDPMSVRLSPNWNHADRNFWFDQYLRYRPDIELDYVYYYGPLPPDAGVLRSSFPDRTVEDFARAFSFKYGLVFDDLPFASDLPAVASLAAENFETHRVVEWNGKRTVLRMYKDVESSFHTEKEFIAALKRLLVGPKKIGYVTGHGERSIAKRGPGAYQRLFTDGGFRLSLINQGFDVEELRLNEMIPVDIDVLVVADPKYVLSDEAHRNFRHYVDSGRNLLILGEADQQDAVRPLLEVLSLTMHSQNILQKSAGMAEDYIYADYTKAASKLSFDPEPRVRLDPVRLSGAAELGWSEAGEFEVTPILTATGSVENESVALALTRNQANRLQRIIVLSDADVFSNIEINSMGNMDANLSFYLDVARWLGDDEFPISIDRADYPDKTVDIGPIGMAWIRTVYYGLIPLALLVGATLVLTRRRRV